MPDLWWVFIASSCGAFIGIKIERASSAWWRKRKESSNA